MTFQTLKKKSGRIKRALLAIRLVAIFLIQNQ